MREYYLAGVPDRIEKLLTLLDRNPFSKTYGCFDRNFWHYKIKDFPSGMSQEFTLALVLAYVTEFPGNIYFKHPKIREYVEAGIRFAAEFCRKDGSTDDYFPYERALGAAVFSLYALTESYLLLGIQNADFVQFFMKRGCWILENEESGKLTNHHAIAALALLNIYLITKEEKFRQAAQDRIETRVLAWQNEEGWYQEYEGCDPGYLTVTIDFLAQYFKKTNDSSVLGSLERAVEFFAQIQHPDGTAGGEYGARATAIFHPNGFELLASHIEEAAGIANSYLAAKKEGLLASTDDDYILGHGLISNLNAFSNFKPRNTALLNSKPQDFVRYFKNAGFWIARQGKLWAIFNLLKGGAGKIYRGREVVKNDSGVVARSAGELFVSSFMDLETTVQIKNSGFSLKKDLIRYKQKFATPLIFLIFRKFLFFFGPFKWSSHFVRSYLQRKMILGKKRSQLIFERDLVLDNGGFRVKSRVTGTGCQGVKLSSGLVPIYIAVSECFDKNSLKGSPEELKRIGEGSFELIETIS